MSNYEAWRDLWYKDAIVYSVDVETYQDSDGDGVGDFGGLTRRLDYLSSLGVNCIWLLPFYPTPNRDNGYDITDFYNVDPRFGTLGNFVEFTHRAKQLGMKIIIDLVVNHTSDQHPWFQAAREDPDSMFRNFYVWSEEKPEDATEGMVFPGVQEEVWTYDRKAKAYYFHRFYKHQPDLNIASPLVREELRRIMGFWLELGVSGFRIDAAPFLIELRGIDGAANQQPYEYLDEFRDFLSWRQGDALLLAEANVAMDKVPEYFGDGNRLQMLFNFFGNQHLFLAMAREEAEPLYRAMKALPEIPAVGQWAQFLRNHDEIDLGRLDPEEQADVFAAFGPEPSMQLYERGIRRRLAPMLGNDQRRLRMAFSLLFTLPGTPVIWYGDEIGMGDDLSLDERNSVRTPMQWSEEHNAGFSTAYSDDLIRPVITDGQFGANYVNVNEAERNDDSLLNWFERTIRQRKSHPSLGWGTFEPIKADQPQIFAHRAVADMETLVAVHNLSGQAATGSLDLPDDEAEALVEVFGDDSYEPYIDEPGHLRLNGYGFRWFRLPGRPDFSR